jgi:tRNA(adenine34) deaminase
LTAIDSDDDRWMRHAMKLAQRAEADGEVPVGAVLVLNGELVAEGWNRPIGMHDPAAHAEIMALRAGGERLGNYRLTGSTLYVTLEPCLMCVGAIVHARVMRLVYGTADPKSGVVDTLCQGFALPGLNHRPEVSAGVLADACSEQLKRFFRSRRGSLKS